MDFQFCSVDRHDMRVHVLCQHKVLEVLILNIMHILELKRWLISS